MNHDSKNKFVEMGKKNLSEFELFFYGQNERFRKIYGHEKADKIEEALNFLDFFSDVYQVGRTIMKPLLTELTHKQYVALQKVEQKVLQDYMDDAYENYIFSLLFSMKQLSDLCIKGVDANEHFEMDEIRKYHSSDQSVEIVSPVDIDYDAKLDEWERLHRNEDLYDRLYAEYEVHCYREFTDKIQPVLFSLMPELQNLENDYWILFAFYMRSEFEDWQFACENVESTYDWALPPESINWEVSESHELLMSAMSKDPPDSHYYESAFDIWMKEKGIDTDRL